MTKNRLILGLVVIAALVALVVWGRNEIHFDFGVFRAQLALANWWMIALGIGCIYLGYVFRSVRWALLLRHNKKVPLLSLMGTQVIGYTAVALIGRVADPVRPYLVSKKTGLPLSNQFAVYVVERLFDAGSMALLFSLAILLSPPGAMPHPELVKKSGYGMLFLTIMGASFLVAVRLAGGWVASFFEQAFGLISKNLGRAIAKQIRSFRTGLDTMRSLSDLGAVLSLSLIMWVLIAASYLVTCLAFVASPELASMTPAKCVLLMVASGTASIFQLPILGWFTQIALVTAALSKFFGAAWEPATACAATLLLVTFLGIIPIGLIWAQFEHVNLRKLTVESEHADKGVIGKSPANAPEADE